MLKADILRFYATVCVQGLESTTAQVRKKLYEDFYGSRGSCAKSDKLPQDEDGDYKSENKKKNLVACCCIECTPVSI